MTPLQALVTGAIAGSLMNLEDSLMLEIDVALDDKGDYTNEIVVTGRESREQLLVTVTTVDKKVTSLIDRIKEYSS